MLKRIFTTALTAIICATTIQAQAQEQEVKKPRLLIEAFGNTEGLSKDLCDRFRMNVISAINATERFEVMDAKTQELLDEEAARRTSESAMADQTARTEGIVTKANNYILRGALLSCATQSTVVDGKTRYTYQMEYSLTLTDASNSKEVFSKTIQDGSIGTQSLVGGTGGKLLNTLGTCATAEKALEKAMDVAYKIEGLIIEHLPLKGEMLTDDITEKAGKNGKNARMENCYINLGSGLGAKVDDNFAIMAAEVRAGRTIYQEVGRLKIIEVVDPTLSHCKITTGGKLVLEKMNAYKAMVADDPNTPPIIVHSVQ